MDALVEAVVEQARELVRLNDRRTRQARYVVPHLALSLLAVAVADLDEEEGDMGDPFWEPPYSFTEQVAEEARRESQRYWAVNDRRFPVAEDMDKAWPIGEPPAATQPKTRRGLARR